MSIQNLGPLLIVGESTGSIGLDGEVDFHAALNNMAAQAKNSVKIFTQELDPELYDQPEFLKVMSDIARNRKRCKIQILIQSPEKAAKSGHRLVELQKRLTSAIQIHSIPENEISNNEEFMVIDDIAITRRFSMGFMHGNCEFKSIPEAQKKSRFFDLIWQQSNPCQEFRRLGM
ncbi:MAG: hypothetical protein KUG73_11585 [Pseudomonadales bacterium]|nr:hypothetical protein [Pseudomonadales bacterium]